MWLGNIMRLLAMFSPALAGLKPSVTSTKTLPFDAARGNSSKGLLGIHRTVPTLIELLVVVAIIATLAAMLLPALTATQAEPGPRTTNWP